MRHRVRSRAQDSTRSELEREPGEYALWMLVDDDLGRPRIRGVAEQEEAVVQPKFQRAGGSRSGAAAGIRREDLSRAAVVVHLDIETESGGAVQLKAMNRTSGLHDHVGAEVSHARLFRCRRTDGSHQLELVADHPRTMSVSKTDGLTRTAGRHDAQVRRR